MCLELGEMLEDLKINRTSKTPVNRQIAAYFRQKVLSGELKPGDRLDTVKKMANTLGVGSRTVSQTLKQLKSEGILEATPRRGTFVRDFSVSKASTEDTKGQIESEYLKVAVICSKKSEQADDYGCNLGILNGIFRESERYNVVVQVLPFSIKESSEDELFESLLDFDTKGVIWLTPQKNDWKKIDYLRMNNLPVIAARRWRVKNGGPCVETDFNTAGFETGEKFLENGCDNALIIDNSRRTSKFDDRAGRFVLSISEGLARSFSRSGDYSPEKIDVKSLDFQTPQTKSEICKLLTNIKPETGIVFADGGILLNLLEWDKEKFYKCLFDKQFAVLGFDLINSWIISEAKGLKFWILNEPLEALGRNAVQKVLSIHKGYLADTTTLVKVKLQFVNG